MNSVILKIDNVAKKYKLGQIGGTTLREELQRKMAKLKGIEDPTKKIGSKDYGDAKEFWALNGVSFEIKKGERVGIIGHNGAGKSTLLKLISRVTAPSLGSISMNGRVASMLEVGTGFHPELTGRENIYMNGAILGMTKREIDKKIDDIIDFSECRKFIDTPVKRYSSGMYVKLAFSVAANLDSDIMIMDEVLAVGDMAFQKKCLNKMNEVSKNEGRTILYVSHNMSTIKELCDRVIVLDHGGVVFDGDVNTGIAHYLNIEKTNSTEIDYSNIPRLRWLSDTGTKMKYISFIGKENTSFQHGEDMNLLLKWINEKDIDDLCLRVEILNPDRTPIGTSFLYDFYSGYKGEEGTVSMNLCLSSLAPGEYTMTITMFLRDKYGNNDTLDCVHGLYFEVLNSKEIVWDVKNWGKVEFPPIKLIQE